MFLTNILLFTIVVILVMIFYEKENPDKSHPLIFGVSTLLSIFIIGLFYLVFYLISKITL